MAGHAGHGRAHGVLADPVVDLVALGVLGGLVDGVLAACTPVLPVRSAEPATNPGITSAVAVMHWLMATRVARLVPASKTGSFSDQPCEAPAALARLPHRLVPVPGVEARLPGAPCAPRPRARQRR